MSEVFTLESVVSYWDVDRDQVMTLGGVFKLLQEAAIKHADVYGLGAKVMTELGESWVLNRVAAEISRYPRYEEKVTVRTWSAGIRGFRGYRDLRVFVGDELVVKASTLWIYVNVRTKSLARVPAELAASLPVGSGEVYQPELERRRYEAPGPTAAVCDVPLRYGDFDGNSHLNNTAYFDTLQTALHTLGHPARPTQVEVQFVKEVPLTTPIVTVAVEPREDGAMIGWRSAGGLNAQGRIAWA